MRIMWHMLGMWSIWASFSANRNHNANIMQILTFAAFKGGQGKTTSAWAVGHTLSHYGHRVLLVDADPQRNLTQCLASNADESGLSDVIDGSLTLAQAMQPIGERLWLVQATSTLAAAEKVLGTDGMYALVFRNALDGLEGLMDYVIFDTSPSPNSPLALAAITAADRVLVPVQPEYFAFNGLEHLLELAARIRKNFSPKLQVSVFFTKYAAAYRRSLHHQFVDMMREHADISTLLLETTIRENVSVAEAQVNKMPLQEWDTSSAALQDYIALTKEITALSA